MPAIKVKVAKDVLETVEDIMRRSGRSLDAIVEEALVMWLIDADGETGIPRRKVAGFSATKKEYVCPNCGGAVVSVETPHAPLGFCVKCMDVTLSEQQLAELADSLSGEVF